MVDLRKERKRMDLGANKKEMDKKEWWYVD